MRAPREGLDRQAGATKHLADAFFAALAVALAIPSMALPFGHDQGLYYYVGREWLLRGSIPYRDVFEHKTPGLYALHAISIMFFGEHEWSIRIADLMGVVALGGVVARLATPRGERVPPGLWGIGCLVASILHYGFFDYWDTAQSELWYTTLALAGAACVLHGRAKPAFDGLAGTLSAAALLMKPPAAGMVAVTGLVLLISAREGSSDGRTLRVLSRSAWFAGGFLALFLVTLGYFGLHGALPAMLDIVVGANSYYVAHEKEVTSLREVVRRIGHFIDIMFPFSMPLLLLLPFGLTVARRRAKAEWVGRYGVLFALYLAAFAAVCVQQKFYWIHWLVMIGPTAALTVAAVRDGGATLMKRAPGKAAWAFPIAGIAILGCFVLNVNFRTLWLRQAKLVWQLESGSIPRSQFARAFQIDRLYYFEADIEDASNYIKGRARPGDAVCARGFHPEVYALTGLRYGGRFFWTNFLIDPRRAYRREDYLAEDAAAFASIRPRFVVTLTFAHGNLDSADYYIPMGYTLTRTFGALQVLELAQ